MNNRTDFYQKGWDNAVYGFAYIPDFDSEDEKKEFTRGYKEGKHLECSKRVANLTATNQHTQARIVLARYVGNASLAKLYASIENIILTEGYLPSYLSQYQMSLDERLIESVKYQFGDEKGLELLSNL